MRNLLAAIACLSGQLLASTFQSLNSADTSVPAPTSEELARIDSLKLAAFAQSFAQGVPSSDSLRLWQPPSSDSMQATAEALHALGNQRRDSLRTWLAQEPDSLEARMLRLREEARNRRDERLSNLSGFDTARLAQELESMDLSLNRRRRAIETVRAK